MKIVEIKLLHNNHSPSFMFLHLVSPVHFLRVAAKSIKKNIGSFILHQNCALYQQNEPKTTNQKRHQIHVLGRKVVRHVRTFWPWEPPFTRVLNLSWWQGGPLRGSKNTGCFFFFQASCIVVMNHGNIFVAQYIYIWYVYIYIYCLSRFRCLHHTDFCSNSYWTMHNKKPAWLTSF